MKEAPDRLRRYISFCIVCGKPIVRMRKRRFGPGLRYYRLEWSHANYCKGGACKQIAYRRRKMAAMMNTLGNS